MLSEIRDPKARAAATDPTLLPLGGLDIRDPSEDAMRAGTQHQELLCFCWLVCCILVQVIHSDLRMRVVDIDEGDAIEISGIIFLLCSFCMRHQSLNNEHI